MTWPATPAAVRLGVRLPIVQAPMAGVTTPDLVAAVSNAGGLGSLGAALLAPGELRTAIRAVRARTAEPFAVNLFAWDHVVPADPATTAAMVAALAPFRARLGLSADAAAVDGPGDLAALLADQLAVVAAERVPVFSFALGIPPLDAVREAGCVLVGSANTVAEARALEWAGVDLIVAQGAEAGGHRSGFPADGRHALIGSLALIPQVVDAVSVPVLAAGGIGDARGIAAALMLGAGGVQLGTAFLGCPESAAPPAHKRALPTLAADATTVTAVCTGRPARVRRSALIDALEAGGATVPPFPLQAELTGPLHAAAAERSAPESMLLLAGQAACLARPFPAGRLVGHLADGVGRRLGAVR